MTSAAKPTKGPVKRVANMVWANGSIDTYGGAVGGCIVACENTIQADADGRIWECDGDAKANADLICEAFNVHTETGRTPRQLADERDELLAVLKKHHEEGIAITGEYWEDYPLIVETAAIIAKVEARP